MDRQNRVGSKPGSGGVLSGAAAEIAQRERLKQLAMQSIDLNKDPYFMRNHLGSFECKLCGTTHPTEGNYLHHTQCKRHQHYLAKRIAKDKRDAGEGSVNRAPTRKRVQVRKTIKIGRPGYKVLKQYKPETGQKGLTFELVYPDIEQGLRPRHRLMSSFEQTVGPKDPQFQYILFAGEPYETVGFRIPNQPLESIAGHGKFLTTWDEETKTFRLSLFFEPESNDAPEDAANN